MSKDIRGYWDSRRVMIGAEELLPDKSQKVWNHSPDGFMWSYGGSGPAQLALAILLEFMSEEKAKALYQQFKNSVIANLPKSDFVLKEVDLTEWIDKHREGIYS